MYSEEKKQVLKTAKLIDRYQLIALSGGNVSCRVDNHIIVTPSGMIYDDLEVEDILVVDLEGNLVEGTLKPSVDTIALRYMYNHLPNVKAIIHTHQPYATAIGLIQDEFPCNLTTLANAAKGSVNVAPFSSAASEEMGVQAVNYLDGKLAVILKNHGVIAVGDSLKQALYACVYLEEAAKTYCVAKSMGMEVASLTDRQIQQAIKIFEYYGQGKQNLPIDLFD